MLFEENFCANLNSHLAEDWTVNKNIDVYKTKSKTFIPTPLNDLFLLISTS